jgi:16S rRNA C967 or C1407 C5-methylase (RsmB/RsmF family)
MEQESELHRLERFVESLLDRFARLREDNRRLQEKLKDREEEIQNLHSNISSSDMERNEISLRVNRLVAQIEEWERNLGEEEPLAADPVDNGEDVDMDSDSGAGSGAFEAVAEETSLPAAENEEEGRVQHNLFSMGTSSPEE